MSFAERIDADGVLIEAESLQDPGGWNVDTRFVHIMGSPYLLAHGLAELDRPTLADVQGAQRQRLEEARA